MLFDYDKLYLEYYNELPDSELRDKFALDRTTRDFENAIKNSLENGLDFFVKQLHQMFVISTNDFD